MVDHEPEVIMARNKEASLGCFNTMATSFNDSQDTVKAETNPEIKDVINAYPVFVSSNNSFCEEGSIALNHVYSGPFCLQENWTRANFYPDVQKVQQRKIKGLEDHFYPAYSDYYFPVENKIQHVPLKLISQGYPHGFVLQDFNYFVVIDFEATCDKERKPYPQEIIEFPSVLVNGMTGQLEASFQTYVRPAYHQHLTDFCKELTGIQQIQVDRGVPLSEALLMHDKWLEEKGIKHKSFAVVTWGNWDCRTMLDSECKFKGIQKPQYFERWINLKVPFHDVFGGVHCNLKEAVQLAGLAWLGRPHCGLDDARNTARLVAVIMLRGFKFAITNSLIFQPEGTSLAPHYSPSSHSFKSSPQHQGGPNEFHPAAAQSHRFVGPPPIPGRQCAAYCFCGVMSSKRVIRRPGPMQGRCFFGCGNWSSSRPASCNYFMWSSPP